MIPRRIQRLRRIRALPMACFATGIVFIVASAIIAGIRP